LRRLGFKRSDRHTHVAPSPWVTAEKQHLVALCRIEQHALHLPLGVDTLSAVAVAEGVSARTGFPVLPAIPVGCSLGHSKHWPGTLSLRPETLARVVYEIAEWVEAAGFQRLVILNGHVTNWAPLRCALENVRADFPEVRIELRSITKLNRQVRLIACDGDGL
jgi:creatinine amidohydrolase